MVEVVDPIRHMPFWKRQARMLVFALAPTSGEFSGQYQAVMLEIPPSCRLTSAWLIRLCPPNQTGDESAMPAPLPLPSPTR